MNKYILTILSVFLAVNVFAQSKQQIREGNRDYKDGDFEHAEEQYRRAIQDDPASLRGTYNLGNAIYEQGRYEEAVKHYSSAEAIAKDGKTKSDALYNLGNAYLAQQNLEESINAYKQALKINPKDMATKYNLAYALQQMKMQQQQQQEQQQQQQEGEQSEDQEEQDQQQQQEQEQQEQQEEQEQQQQQQNQSEGEEEKEQNEESEEQPQPQDMSKEEAMKILDIMENEDQKVQEKLRKGDKRRSKSDKDW